MSLPKITSAMLIVTHACNLACRYCFVHQEPSRMTLDTAKRAAEFLIQNAEEQGDTPEINFFGGEPMLLWDAVIAPLTRWIREEYAKPFRLSMTSNCTLMTDERLDFMKTYDVGLLFSLDGAKETQDYNRPYHGGRGSFDALEPIIPKILEAYPGMTLRMTAIPATCGHVFENIRWGEAMGYTDFFVVPNVFERWDMTARETLAGEVRKYGDYYIECYRMGKIPLTFATFEDAFQDIRDINDAEIRGVYRVHEKCKAEGKCGLGSSKFASIDPDGNIYGCQEMTSNEGIESIFYIGNVEDGAEEERRRALMRTYSLHAAKGKNCRKCPYDRICNGGCVANNYMMTGTLHELPEVFCWWRRVILEEAVRVMQTLGGERNEAFKTQWECKT